MPGSKLKRRVTAPDGRTWVVQLVWWARPGAGHPELHRLT